MKVNQKVRYGMACLLELAKNPTEFMDSNEIAAKQTIPPAYAHKVLQSMAHGGLVYGMKGAGYKIQKPLSEITALDVIEALSKEEQSSGTGIGNEIEARINQTLGSLVLSELLVAQ